jgi:cellulose synthase/poly-beta-1,6-N-acetylglucosamine synthase-like glycosyltransferase
MTDRSKQPFISVLAPIRNEEHTIKECIDSILNQDYSPDKMEILVIDGVSTDTTRDIINQLAPSRLRVLTNPRKTVPHALNTGLERAKGDIIVRVDGHATLEPDYLSRCVDHLQRTGADCVGGVILSKNSTLTGRAIALAMSSPFGVGNARFRTSGKAGFVDTLAFGAYRKPVFEQLGVFDEELTRCQDDEFNYRLRKAGGSIYFTPEIRSHYTPRSSLLKLWKQYFQYGLYKVRVLQKHLRMMQLRQFVPPLFVMGLFGSLLASLVYPLFWGCFGLVVTSYVCVNLFFTIKIAWRKGIIIGLYLPLIFLILHTSYGLGFLTGLFKFANKWRKETG